MIFLSVLCLLIGIFPQYLYSILPYTVEYIPYTYSHVLFQLQLLLFAGFAFFVMLPFLKRTETISLDIDWFFRVFLFNLVSKLYPKKIITHFNSFLSRNLNLLIKNFFSGNAFIRNISSGEMTQFVGTLFAIYLFVLFNIIYMYN